EGEVLLEKRSMKKDLYPGIWCNIAGHVDSGESYDEAARRELKEETGLDCKLDFLFNIRMKAEKESELISVFKCVSEGPFKINKEETQYVRFFDIEALKDMLKQGGLLTPGTFLILTKFLKNRGESNG
ncbi:MAG: NUDIX domain-containing protein, partial [Candidatus Aenigmarchaeota archaeon]|nr:NUDIX domain-containing protein [Candidatus Aenigmarchaeota archaeon]